MKNILSTSCLILLLQSCTSTDQESVSSKIKNTESHLTNPIYLEGDTAWTIQERMKHYDVHGFSIAVIENNRIAWVKSYGVMDTTSKKPVTNTTLFQAGSISKPVAAYAALQAVEKGKIGLTQNVNNFLRSWKLPDNEFTKDKKVTLKDLLSHTGGITVHGFLGYSPGLPVPSLLQVLDGAPPANSPPIRVDKIPEKSYRYAGGGYCIMQQMLIDVEGKPFPEILNESVLQPLSMDHSTYEQPLSSQKLKLAATGYLPDGSETKGKRHTYPEMAAAGLWTTADDLARFAIDIQETLKGESTKVLSKTMVTEMLTPFVEDFIGMGIFLENHQGEIYFQHGGWDEGFSSTMVAHKTKGYGVVILSNANKPAFLDEVVRSVAMTYGWSNYLRSYKKLPMDSAKFSSVVGRYGNGSDGGIEIFNKGNRLFFKYLRGTPHELFKISDSSYTMRDDTRRVEFKTNPTDKKLNLILFKDDHQKPEFTHPLLADEEVVPYEFLLSGKFNEAVDAYRALLKTPKDEMVTEDNLNREGYDLLNSGEYKLAVDFFKIITLLYPSSANAYDSYAEACMKNGENDLAIINYKKSLSMNPDNENARKKIEALKTKK